jgi:hypothetical protein
MRPAAPDTRTLIASAMAGDLMLLVLKGDGGGRMATLHIEHEITDLDTWLAAFGRFAEARQNAGVKAERVAQPVDDERYIYVELDFDTAEQAEVFKQFLETKVWSNPDASPALGGTPRARVLNQVEAG